MVKRLNPWSAICLAGLAMVAAPLAAQDEQPRRHGLWGNIGLGFGSAALNTTCCGTSDRESGVSGFASIGGTVSPKFLLGVESDGWSKDDNGVTVSFYNLSAIGYFYPSPTQGFFLKGGIGLGGTRVSSGGSSASENGFGFVAGAGYDVPVSRKISLTPTGTFAWAKPTSDYSQNFFSIGVAVTFH
jgi:outer membrane protein with beta-barrel domain